MSWWVIKMGGSYLCDYRPKLECPQWYYDFSRAFKFDTLVEAKAFWEQQKRAHEIDREDVRFVRHYSREETRERRVKLDAVVATARHFAGHSSQAGAALRWALEQYDAVGHRPAQAVTGEKKR